MVSTLTTVLPERPDTIILVCKLVYIDWFRMESVPWDDDETRELRLALTNMW